MDTYGAKLVENIVQGIARDILLYAMQNLSDYRIVAHVHDEIIIEAEKNIPVESICKIMSQTPEWAEGLLLRADGYECDFYKDSMESALNRKISSFLLKKDSKDGKDGI